MKYLLLITALIEIPTGLGLLVASAVVVQLLMGEEISGVAVPLGRVAGVALLAPGVACWLAGDDTKSRGARGLVVAMLVYNVGAVVILGMAGIQLPTVGTVLWLAVILHAVMAVWCGSALVVSGKNVPH